MPICQAATDDLRDAAADLGAQLGQLARRLGADVEGERRRLDEVHGIRLRQAMASVALWQAACRQVLVLARQKDECIRGYASLVARLVGEKEGHEDAGKLSVAHERELSLEAERQAMQQDAEGLRSQVQALSETKVQLAEERERAEAMRVELEDVRPKYEGLQHSHEEAEQQIEELRARVADHDVL